MSRRRPRNEPARACPYYYPTLAGAISILAAAALSVTLTAQGRFQPKPVTAYTARQKIDKITIAVEPFDTPEKVRPVFGKSDPLKLGAIPILVVIANDSDHAIQLDRMRVEFISLERRNIVPVSSEDLQRSGRVKAPDVGGSRFPGIPRRSPRPKDQTEIALREFAAPVVEAHDRAYGFFYFRVPRAQLTGSKIYITGMRDAQTGRDILYAEINLK